ncbi:MAG TPA: hypothetical protein VET89_12795, partial [Stellaceae bacterium]|nr:hypothetical protein [Stellaceae bacterium]
TDAYSWQWLFLVNIVPGVFVAVTVWCLIDIDKPNPSLLRGFDFPGLVLMALFLGCLEYTLEEGPRWDWFADGSICAAAIVSGIASVLFLWRVCPIASRSSTCGPTASAILRLGLSTPLSSASDFTAEPT